MRATSDRYQRIYAVVSRIPRGRVATYGQVAALARLPRQARFVGYALHALPADSDVPWHRVVNAAGRISLRADAFAHDELQAHLLRREGVRSSPARSRWRSTAGSRAAEAAARPRPPDHLGCGTIRMYGFGAFQPDG